MFFRKKPEPPAPTTAANVESPRTRDRKGHATPTRKEAQAARQRPLVIEDRKAAKVAAQQARFEQQQKVNQAMQTVGKLLPSYWAGRIGTWPLVGGDFPTQGVLVIGTWAGVLVGLGQMGFERVEPAVVHEVAHPGLAKTQVQHLVLDVGGEVNVHGVSEGVRVA